MIPAAEVSIDADLVYRLLREQAPRLATLELRPAAAGWDNQMFRLGTELAVRLPRRESAVPLLLNEASWAAKLAGRLPLPVPVPVFQGSPGGGYPFPWLITNWLEGEPATGLCATRRDGYAAGLAAFLAAFHTAEGAEAAPVNDFRGVPVGHRVGVWRDRLASAEHILTPAQRLALASAMDDAEAAERWRGAPLWLHGDPHPMNVLASGPEERLREGAEAVPKPATLTAVLDLGDLTAGDPASDLGAAWVHFTPRGRVDFLAEYRRLTRRGDEALWARARGWGASYLLAMHADPSPLGDSARLALAHFDR